MSTENTKAMEEALQEAVRRMNTGGAAAGPTDPIGLLATLLPKLMAQGGEHEEEREDLLEKLEGLEKEGLGALREQVGLMRKQLHRTLKAQEQTLAQLRELEKRQVEVSKAVLELARQMARVEIIEEVPGEADEDEGASPPAGGRPRHPAGEARRHP